MCRSNTYKRQHDIFIFGTYCFYVSIMNSMKSFFIQSVIYQRPNPYHVILQKEERKAVCGDVRHKQKQTKAVKSKKWKR